MKPLVWTIAGSDSSGGAGIQADLNTFYHLGVHGASVITAVTAQNMQAVTHIEKITNVHQQLTTLSDGLMPTAIKIGMLGQEATLNAVRTFLKNYSGNVVLDPVMLASSGNALFEADIKHYAAMLKTLFPYLDLLTPNIPEAEILLDKKINSLAAMEEAAHELLALGSKNILIKGGHLAADEECHDYWTNGDKSFWLVKPRFTQSNYRGTGCVLSSAITAILALGYDLQDALVIASMYVNRGIRLANRISTAALLHHDGWPEDEIDLPRLKLSLTEKSLPTFPDCGVEALGLYPIVDSSAWVKKLLALGVKTVQLRIKNKIGDALEEEIRASIQLAKQYQARLFINDYWEYAIRHHAYGVHLGQEDLSTANLLRIQQAGLRLGISTHCYHEVARAYTLNPSYLACGPVFATTSKKMMFAPQGIENLKRWQRTITRFPWVAIGGMDHEKLPSVLSTGVSGVALISAITQAKDPIEQVQQLLKLVEAYQC